MTPKFKYDVLVLGGGAAGLMTAITAAKKGKKTGIIEHNKKMGAKILISGGGRCNFTNIGTSPQNYVSQNPSFCISALSRYTPFHFIEWVEQYNIPYHEKKSGQLFCTRSAKDILGMLQTESIAGKVESWLETKIKGLEKTVSGFEVDTDQGVFLTQTLVIATGGLSIPKMGATGIGYDIANQFGLKITPVSPALDGFVLPSILLEKTKNLSGVSADVRLDTKLKSFEESLLFTHAGLSGPAALQGSLYWNASEPIIIDWLPGNDLFEKLKKQKNKKIELKNFLSLFFPQSLVSFFLDTLEIKSIPLNQVPDTLFKKMANIIHHWSVVPEKTVGYQKAEVTKGGIDTNELSSKTMESAKVPGLFFVGEVVDVTGELGGYNFQWAWASGHACGKAL
ncbi:MAG TPA: aminoacetone oxidase family FAD-binding enzyme [Deltaproteobacteria bacterium]|nr:MAG: hypothetical protein A2048_06095 [Deltaproteobacteria bacterium GWA2_45_12]HBF12807.1 aminoacetone oxidase family FAD-binding enzyme [Deltaproteobacteria bacterium]